MSRDGAPTRPRRHPGRWYEGSEGPRAAPRGPRRRL